jgi:hypothetical protein
MLLKGAHIIFMKTFLGGFTALALLTSIAVTGCGGGGGSPSASLPAGPASGSPVSPSNSTLATQKLSLLVPRLKSSSLSKAPTPASARVASAARKPMYVSPDTAQIGIYLDQTGTGTNAGPPAKANIALPAETTTTGDTNHGSQTVDTASGETVAWTTAPYTNANGVAYYQISLVFQLLPGQHTVGVVLQAADGFVLSEAQASYTLAAGSNTAATMALQGVADSAFICDWFSPGVCDGGLGAMDADGTYHEVAFVADHEADVLMQQTIGGNVLPLANGPWSLAETDGKNIVTITNAGPFSDPGAYANVASSTQQTTAVGSWYSGQPITIKCNVVNASTTISVQVGKSAQGQVTGFDYTNKWTTPGQFIGAATPSAVTGQGNTMTFSCDAGLSLTVE